MWILACIQTLIMSGSRSGLFIRAQVSFFFFFSPSDCNVRRGRQPRYEGKEVVSKSDVPKPFAASLLSDRSDSDWLAFLSVTHGAAFKRGNRRLRTLWKSPVCVCVHVRAHSSVHRSVNTALEITAIHLWLIFRACRPIDNNDCLLFWCKLDKKHCAEASRSLNGRYSLTVMKMTCSTKCYSLHDNECFTVSSTKLLSSAVPDFFFADANMSNLFDVFHP